MHQFQKSRVLLLKELQQLVQNELVKGHEFITYDIKRYNRKLKAIRKEMEGWIDELLTEEKSKARANTEERQK